MLRGVTDPLVGLPLLALAGWVVRAPLVSPEEGHEAITRAAWDGLDLTDAQQAALICGVRAPDVSLRGLGSFALSSRQPRHALRARPGTTTAEGIRAMRAFVADRHRWALDAADDRRRWEGFGEILHCVQDSYSPAHADRDGARILRMKHWGPFDRLRHAARVGGLDEHGFPTDPRDVALHDGELTEAARRAVPPTRAYLEMAARAGGDDELLAYLDAWVTGPAPPDPGSA
jgi:hypothetical protein